MQGPQQQPTGPAARPNTARRKRARQISNWLAFIRPHVDRYLALPRGEQKKFVDKLSEKTGSSGNTLRRYIAAAQVLEAHGVTEFPPGLKRLPVAAVEAIERISKQDPARGRELFKQLIEGLWSIRELKEKLADIPQRGRPANRALRVKSITNEQLVAEIAGLSGETSRQGEAGQADFKLIRFVDWPMEQGLNLLSRAALPRFVVPLPTGAHAVVFDDSAVRWHASPAVAMREFLRNIAIAATIFDYVVVLCGIFRQEVEREVMAMRDDCRRRIRILSGTTERGAFRLERRKGMTPVWAPVRRRTSR